MDDDFFPFYCLEYRGKSFHEVCTTHGGTDALTKIKTVLSNGIAKNYRKFCVDYAKRQQSRAILPVGYRVPPGGGTKNTRLP